MLFGPTSLGNALMTVISFLILLYIVYRFAFKPFDKILTDRRDKINKDIADAETANEQAQTMKTEADEELIAARREGTQIIQDAKKQALEQKRQMIQDTEKEIVLMREDADRKFELERQQLLQKMEANTVTLAVELTKRLVHHEVSAEQHQQVIEQFIQGLEDEVNEKN